MHKQRIYWNSWSWSSRHNDLYARQWFGPSLREATMRHLGVGSLTFRELSKIIPGKYTPEITFTVSISSWNFLRISKAWLRAHVQSFWISSWNFVRMSKAWLRAHVQSFSLKFSSQVLFLQYTNFERIFWRARETLVKQPLVDAKLLHQPLLICSLPPA